MQTVGEQFTDTSAFAGNDICTLPDFPAEIRAPTGSLPGVSGFQIQFGSREILTPGDAPEVLVAMNPAALKVNLKDLVPGGILVVNTDAFTDENIEKAGYKSNPLDDETIGSRFEFIKINISNLTKDALEELDLKPSEKLRCKNFFALGMMYWIYDRPIETTEKFLNEKWGKRKPIVAEANIKALRTGYYYGETYEGFRNRYQIAKAVVESGTYRKISGSQAMVYGLLAEARAAKREILYSGYPITPASPVLENFAALKQFGVKTIQAEDEISAIGIAIGASYAGHIGITGTSGPGMCLKAEFMGLAVTAELPLIICDVQRAGPSTGLPTKTEQTDLLMSLYGRNGESPLPVVAASSPSDCYDTAVEAMRIALKYSTPVILMSELYLANGSEPWKIPDVDAIPDISVPFAKEGEEYVTYRRNPDTLARTQAIPGQKGLEHRIGGLEKDETGSVSYDPDNHERMSALRAQKVEAIAKTLSPLKVCGATSGKLLVVGWGGSYGAITSAVSHLQKEGYSISSVHLRHLNPLPLDLEGILKNFDHVLVPEMNSGQLTMLLRARYLVDAKVLPKLKGQPFTVADIREKALEFFK